MLCVWDAKCLTQRAGSKKRRRCGTPHPPGPSTTIYYAVRPGSFYAARVQLRAHAAAGEAWGALGAPPAIPREVVPLACPPEPADVEPS